MTAILCPGKTPKYSVWLAARRIDALDAVGAGPNATRHATSVCTRTKNVTDSNAAEATEDAPTASCCVWRAGCFGAGTLVPLESSESELCSLMSSRLTGITLRR